MDLHLQGVTSVGYYDSFTLGQTISTGGGGETQAKRGQDNQKMNCVIDQRQSFEYQLEKNFLKISFLFQIIELIVLH